MGAKELSALVVVSALSLAATNATAREPRGAMADCATQSGASFPGAFASPRNLVIGPLAMIGAAGAPSFASSFHGQKFPLLLRAGHRATLELSRQTRKGAGLAYGPLPHGDVGVREAHRVVNFTACRRGERSASDVDGKPVTFWSGGVLALSPRCVPMRVWIDGARAPRRVTLRLGVEHCQ